jgi:hypothetical protein
LGAWPGGWWSRRSRLAAATAASRGAPGSGEDEAGGNGRSVLVVSVGARGGEGRVNLACDRPATGARRGRAQGSRSGGTVCVGGSARRGEGAAAPI